jgi:hypothetical protein
MKYKIDLEGPFPAVQLGENLPDYNYNVPAEHQADFDRFGISELMEGIFEFPEEKLEEIDEFLSNLGYEKE